MNEIALLYLKTEMLPFDRDVAVVAAKLRHELVSTGRTRGVEDTFIAAIALHYDLIVVTSNVKHFEGIEGLDFEDWRR